MGIKHPDSIAENHIETFSVTENIGFIIATLTVEVAFLIGPVPLYGAKLDLNLQGVNQSLDTTLEPKSPFCS